MANEKEFVEGAIPEKELEQFDVNATDMRFEDEVFENEEMGDVAEGEEVILPDAPKTHSIEDAVSGTLEEE